MRSIVTTVMCLFLGGVMFTGCAPAKDTSSTSAKDVIVVLETNQGKMELLLYPDKAPKTCENFVGLVNKGYYNGLTFHRVIKGFMIQGGDPKGDGSGGESLWGGTFEDEFSPDLTFNKMGILAMANRGPSTNGSQFFITTAPAMHLNGRHTIFGEVLSGYDVLTKIEEAPKDAMDKPVEPQIILKAYVKKE